MVLGDDIGQAPDIFTRTEVLNDSPASGGLWAEFDDGTTVEVGANSPLLLTTSNTAWIVDTKSVQVFVVSLRDGQPSGARSHLFSLEPGDLVFSADAGADTTDAAMLLAGVPGSRVRQLPEGCLDDLLANPETAVEAAARLHQWVDKASVAVRPTLPPQKYERLQPGTESILSSGDDARPSGELVWVRCREGRATLWSREQVGLPTDGTWFPLSGESWVTATEPTMVMVASTSAVIADEGFWPALQAFNHAVLRSAQLTAESAAVGETERLRRKAESDDRALDQAFAALINEFTPTQHLPIMDGGEQNALLTAARIVGEATGIAIHPPPKSTAQQHGDRLLAIASASRIRTRKVALRGRWWQAESAPTLAYLAVGDAPMALVPTGRQGYLLVDPRDGSRTVVTPQIAETLAPFGHVFYRPLPDDRLGVRDLLHFAMHRSGVDLGMVLLIGMIGGGLSLLTPIATGMLFDEVIPSAQRSQVLIITLALVASAISSALFQLTRSLVLLRIETRMGSATQAAVWDRLLNLSVPFFHRFSAGDLQLRVMGIDAIRQIMGGAVISSVLAAIFSLFSFVLLFYYSVTLALVATLLVALIIGVTFLLSFLQLRYQRQIMTYHGRLNGMLVQFITGISKIRLAAAENRAFLVWSKAFARQTEVTSKVRMLSVHLAAVQSVTPVLTTMAIFATIVYGSASLSTGSFLAFSSAFGQFLAAMLSLTAVFVSILQIVPIFERAQPILDAEPEVGTAKADPGVITGDVEINHVSFRYRPDGPLVLDDVSIRITPGEFVAFVGPSGSGKSTIMRLLMGFEAPSSGTIYYDRQNLSDLDVRSIRRQVGVVLQHSQLMPGDIQGNILGNSGYTVADAWNAAQMAGIDEDIKNMPMGMFTAVSEGISTLSGGQRQRLMIARALVSKPRVIFFDEATSALDNHTQAMVSRSLESLQATRIVIAHRLSTIRKADHIYVIRAGRVVQSGTYDELIVSDGPFLELAKRQLV